MWLILTNIVPSVARELTNLACVGALQVLAEQIRDFYQEASGPILRLESSRPHHAVGTEPLGFVQGFSAVQAMVFWIELDTPRPQLPVCVHVLRLT